MYLFMNYNHKTTNKLLYILIAFTLLFGFISVTNPTQIPLPLIIVPFLLIGLILFQVTQAILTLRKPRQQNHYLIKIAPFSIAMLGVGLLLLATLRQLTWKDTLLVIILAVVFWSYVSKADFLQK